MTTEYRSVVVGAAQGIGEVVARRLATGGPILLADRNAELVEGLAADLRAGGGTADAIVVDITDTADVARMVAAAGRAPRVAIVAGLFAAVPSLDAEVSEFERIFAVNTFGTYDVARQFARAMAADGGGAIVAIGSIAARMPRMRQAAYAGSKAGMRQALRVLAMEVIEHGVRINFVAPGPTESPMMRQLANDHSGVQLWDGDLGALRPRIPNGRVARPDDVAAAIEFLLSDDATHVVMHDLYVDGGESLGL